MNNLTIHSIAGFCNEKALWKLLADLSSLLLDNSLKGRKVVMPEMVIVDGEVFSISDTPTSPPTMEFYPPEGIDNYGEEGLVWSLGALVCYASSGHYVFGGRGGIYQRSHPKAELPTLKKEHSALASLVKRCLCYSPHTRISLSELHIAALKGLESKDQVNRVKRTNDPTERIQTSNSTDDIWPEKMG